ncbi:MAG: class I tRNA ligase family protein, partial [Gammaproteobacteria bacterium]|nr:class I tRNA ligase family protein [Gammaproteobacteria bacterium]
MIHVAPGAAIAPGAFWFVRSGWCRSGFRTADRLGRIARRGALLLRAQVRLRIGVNGLSFKEVSSRYDGPALEKEVLAFWREHQTFEQTLVMSEGRPRFSFNEGPPTANGKPGIHHVLARAFKDIFPRYKTMRGYYVPRKAGWDTH